MNTKLKIITFILSCIILIMLIVSCQNIETSLETSSATLQTNVTESNVETYVETKNESELFQIEWEYAENPNITDKERNIVKSYITKIDGIGINPIANIAQRKIEDGYDYLFLCTTSPVMPNARKSYSIIWFSQTGMTGDVKMVKRYYIHTSALSSFAFAPTFQNPDDLRISEELNEKLNKVINKSSLTPICLIEETKQSEQNIIKYMLLYKSDYPVKQFGFLFASEQDNIPFHGVATLYFE